MKTNMSFGHDFEVPAGCQDADIEMADLQRSAAREARLKKAGICTHGWYQAKYGQPAVCLECGKVFACESDLNDERRENLI